MHLLSPGPPKDSRRTESVLSDVSERFLRIKKKVTEQKICVL